MKQTRCYRISIHPQLTQNLRHFNRVPHKRLTTPSNLPQMRVIRNLKCRFHFGFILAGG